MESPIAEWKSKSKRKVTTMHELDGRQEAILQRPITTDREAWQTYWNRQGLEWRTEPEISSERQEELERCRSTVPNSERGIYPFKGLKLSRADVEWLLATHENERGPVDWSDERQRKRTGLNLRGADLRKVDLHKLPLAGLRCGLAWKEWGKVAKEQGKMAAALMNEVNLSDAQLQGAIFCGAQLQGAILSGAQLERADLSWAQLQGAILFMAQLQGADLFMAQLQGAELADVHLSDKNHIGPRLADVQWGNTNLGVVNWSQVEKLGDEYQARQKNWSYALGYIRTKGKETRLRDYKEAVRANRQLAVTFREQGLNEEADHFAYRAQRLQRIVLRRQGFLPETKPMQRIRKLSTYTLSFFLDLLAGYGYKPALTLLWYVLVTFGFAMAYYFVGHIPLFPDAFVFSFTAFHGRGFFPGLGNTVSLHNPIVVIAAAEAIIGLFIEISFIATFTQRFFGR